MARRRIYRVLPKGGSWQVTHDDRVLSIHPTKQPAIDAGRKEAIANQPSQLVVRRTDGTIEFEWTYGSDPYPPQG